KDAQRHGLKVKPIDITKSDWRCTLELDACGPTLRIGMRYVKGMRESVALAIVEERLHAPFTSVDDLARRVRILQKRELIVLGEIGALNFLQPRSASAAARGLKENEQHIHRRDALWQVERSCRRTGPLLETIEELDGSSPLDPMTSEERLVADFHGTGLTIG